MAPTELAFLKLLKGNNFTIAPDGKPTKKGQWEKPSLLKAVQVRGVIAYTSVGLVVGCRGRTVDHRVKLIMRCLREGPKARKGSGQIQEERAWENAALFVFMWRHMVSVCAEMCDQWRVCTVQGAHVHVCTRTHIHTHTPARREYPLNLTTDWTWEHKAVAASRLSGWDRGNSHAAQSPPNL